MIKSCVSYNDGFCIVSCAPVSGLKNTLPGSQKKLHITHEYRNVDFSFIVSGSERTITFRVSLNTLPTLATLV